MGLNSQHAEHLCCRTALHPFNLPCEAFRPLLLVGRHAREEAPALDYGASVLHDRLVRLRRAGVRIPVFCTADVGNRDGQMHQPGANEPPPLQVGNTTLTAPDGVCTVHGRAQHCHRAAHHPASDSHDPLIANDMAS